MSAGAINRIDDSNTRPVAVFAGCGGLCRVQAKALISIGVSICIIGKNVQHTEKTVQELEAFKSVVSSRVTVVGYGGVDFRDFEALRRTVDEAYGQFGRFDLGICGVASNYLIDYNHITAGKEGWEKIVEVDTLGVENFARAMSASLSSKSSAQDPKRFIIMDPTVHHYGFQYQLSSWSAHSKPSWHKALAAFKGTQTSVESYNYEEDPVLLIMKTIDCFEHMIDDIFKAISDYENSTGHAVQVSLGVHRTDLEKALALPLYQTKL